MMPRQSPARAPERKGPERQGTAKPKRPELHVVEPKRDRIRPARVGTIAGVLLFLALFALAAFQTVLIRAQDHLDNLNSAVAQQTDLDQQLKLQLADLQSPEHIAQVARDRLGMIAPNTVTFLEPTPQDDANATYVAPPPKATPPVTTAAPKPSTTTPKASTTTTTPKSTTTTTTEVEHDQDHHRESRHDRPMTATVTPRPRTATRRTQAPRSRTGTTRRPPTPPRPPAPPSRSNKSRVRLLWLLAVVFVGFVLLASKLADLQVLNPGRYREVGEEQRTFSQRIAADRGTIYDRNGVELAMSKPAQSVFVDPTMIDDPFVAASAVAPILGLDERDVEQKMRSDGRFAYLARKVTDEQAQKVSALGLKGVSLVEEPERYHPSGDMARSILGGVDVDNNGLSGLEQSYGDQLTGKPGEVVFERNPEGRTIAVGDHEMVPAVKGDDVVLTLDRSLQYESERILAEQVQATNSKGGIAIVTKPATGEILAMANMVRDGDPATGGTGKIVPGTNNAAVTTTYEPGSVMKLATVGAALERGVVSPQTKIQVPPVLRVGDADFKDAEDHGTVDWTTTEVLSHSSNIGTIKIAQQLGKQPLYDTLRAFGFGTKTALGFPERARWGRTRPEQPEPVVVHLDRYGADRPRRVGHPAADAARLQRRRQRRNLRRAATRALDHRRQRRGASRRDRQRPPRTLTGDVRSAQPDAPRRGGGRHG